MGLNCLSTKLPLSELAECSKDPLFAVLWRDLRIETVLYIIGTNPGQGRLSPSRDIGGTGLARRLASVWTARDVWLGCGDRNVGTQSGPPRGGPKGRHRGPPGKLLAIALDFEVLRGWEVRVPVCRGTSRRSPDMLPQPCCAPPVGVTHCASCSRGECRESFLSMGNGLVDCKSSFRAANASAMSSRSSS